MAPVTPAWVERMNLRRWYAISGDHPDLELQPTAPGTRYLADNDPARDPVLLQVAAPVEAFDTPELHELLTHMRERRWRR